MKTLDFKGGYPEKNLVIEQDDLMQVVVFEVDATTGVRSGYGLSLGKRGDIDRLEVQGEILDQLYIKKVI